MPDLKVNNGTLLFSILSDSRPHPILLPLVDNPEFINLTTFDIQGPPGIIQLLSGSLGISELITAKILSPILDSFSTNPILAEHFANQGTPLEQVNPSPLKGQAAIDQAKKMMLGSVIPGSQYLNSPGDSTGLLALEKTVIASMMQSYKPLMDMAKIIIELLANAEDVVCRFLGTSISIGNKQIGIPSRNPKFWDESLDYAKTLTYSKQDFDKATNAAINAYNNSMSSSNPLKGNNGADTSKDQDFGTDDREALYVGYFDENGLSVDPPTWIKSSNKWVSIIDKNNLTIGSPFTQLDTSIETGANQLRAYHTSAILNIQIQKDAMLTEIAKRGQEINTQYITLTKALDQDTSLTPEQKGIESKHLADQKKTDLASLDAEKEDSIKEFDSLTQTLNDVIDGTNVEGHNYVDDSDLSKGVNAPAILSEWVTKTRGAQLRQKYFPEPVSTVQNLVDHHDKAVEPYIFIPSFLTTYKGKQYAVEVPLAYSNQITQQEIDSGSIFGGGTFFDQRLIKDATTYSLRNSVNNIDLYYNTDNRRPYTDNQKTYFNNNKNMDYVPDKLKSFYLPLEWEEIVEYQVRYKTDPKKIIRTETSTILHKIDVETDYELRLIKVVNLPLLPPPDAAGTLEFFPHNNDIVIINKANQIQFIQVSEAPKLESILLQDVAIHVTTISSTSGSAGALGNIVQTVTTTNVTTIESHRFKTANRYVDSNYYKPNLYFYLRKSKSIWGVEATSKDTDDSEIYQVQDIVKNFIDIKIELNTNPRLGAINSPKQNETGTDFTQHIIINNSSKTIQIEKSKIANLPQYILESNDTQFKILSGLNINREIRIIGITSDTTYTHLTYSGELMDEIISATGIYKTVNKVITLTGFNKVVWDIQYADSSTVRTVQPFTYNVEFDAYIYPITDINYIPSLLTQPNRSIVLQGLNQNSILSSITNKNKRKGLDLTRLKTPDVDIDGIFNISATKSVKTKKGVKINVAQLGEVVPSAFTGRAYSGNRSDIFYFPLRIVGIPNLPTDGSLKDANNPVSKTGTLYTFNNNIPQDLKTDENGNSPVGNLHSTPDINESNLLKEGIIFQGLDPRYVDRTKWKVFWLVEALKKDNRGIAPINKKFNSTEVAATSNQAQTLKNVTNPTGKLYYGLLDKFTAIPLLIAKIVPLIAGKLIPLIVKIIQLISNPSKIKDLLTSLLTDKSISKLPENFKAYDKDNGSLNKVNKYKNEPIPKSFDEPSKIPSDPNYYAGPQIGVKNPSIVSMLDGIALAEFGKSLSKSGKPLFSMGIDVKFAGSPTFKSVTSKKKQTDFTQPPPDKTQSTFETILNFIKMPLEVIFKIFKYVIDWVKKLLNPVKIPKAVADFMSFEWLKEILGKDGLFSILGIVDPLSDPNLANGIKALVAGSGQDAQKLFDKLIKSISPGVPGYEEVSVYNLFRNGVLVGQDIVQQPFNGSPNDPAFSNTSDANRNNNLNNGTSGINSSSICGDRNFSPSALFPLPFLSDMPNFNLCEISQISLKPLEMILGLMKMIQEFLNGLISMPLAILGLDPHIKFPKFGKEIPFANILEDILNQLKAKVVPLSTV